MLHDNLQQIFKWGDWYRLFWYTRLKQNYKTNYTKLEVVKHLTSNGKFCTEFLGEKIVNCDISLPMMPCSTTYDGNPEDAQFYLHKHKPKGWLGEIGKLQDLYSASRNHNILDQQEWHVRFRFISPGVVLPQQVRYKVSHATCLIIVFSQTLLFVDEGYWKILKNLFTLS